MKAIELHNRALKVAEQLRRDYVEMFDVLYEIEKIKAYEHFGVTSLFDYRVSKLELSSNVAYDFKNVVCISLEVPQLREAVMTEKVTISKVRKVCSVINTENADDWIDLVERCPARVVEKAVATENPKMIVQESMKHVSEKVLEFKLAVDEEFESLLKRTKDLLSQKHRRAITSEEALKELMQTFCTKTDPVEKAKRATNRKSTAKSESRYRPANVEHEVNRRDESRCTETDSDGKRCEQRRWLEKHHIKEFANGGQNSAENLTTLCHAHHKIRHVTNLHHSRERQATD